MDRDKLVEILNKGTIEESLFKDMFMEMVIDLGKTLEIAETMYQAVGTASIIFDVRNQVIEYHKSKNHVITLISKDRRVILYY